MAFNQGTFFLGLTLKASNQVLGLCFNKALLYLIDVGGENDCKMICVVYPFCYQSLKIKLKISFPRKTLKKCINLMLEALWRFTKKILRKAFKSAAL